VGGAADEVVAMAITAYELPDAGGASTARVLVRTHVVD
jgi:hypothetical protein